MNEPVDRIPVKLNCRSCGELVTIAADASDNDPVICEGCGLTFTGTAGQIKDALRERVRSELKERVRDIFDRKD